MGLAGACQGGRTQPGKSSGQRDESDAVTTRSEDMLNAKTRVRTGLMGSSPHASHCLDQDRQGGSAECCGEKHMAVFPRSAAAKGCEQTKCSQLSQDRIAIHVHTDRCITQIPLLTISCPKRLDVVARLRQATARRAL